MNLKIQAHNNRLRKEKDHLYRLGRLSSMAFMEKFPTFEEVWPDAEAEKEDVKNALDRMASEGLPTENF